jgi:hypothetical protein
VLDANAPSNIGAYAFWGKNINRPSDV